MNNNDEYIEPPPEPLTQGEWIFFGIALTFLFFELYYMWTWCQWISNCPRWTENFGKKR